MSSTQFGPTSPKRARMDAKQYVQQISAKTEFNKKFKLMTNKASFVIEDLPANPEALLTVLINHCVEEAKNGAKENGITPDRLGASISSRLLNPDIWIPVRKITDNTADAILNRFLEVMQSKTEEGSIWGEPFTITVMVINHDALPKQHEIRGSGKRTPKGVIHQVKRQNLLEVRNQDAYCLFYALVISRIYHTKSMHRRDFSRYMNQHLDRQRLDVHQLMREVGIPFGAPNYNATQYAPPVIDFWNTYYAPDGHRFKLFIFGELGHYKPEFAYGPDNFNIAIPLYHHQQHFDGIRCGVGCAIFGRDNYCFACECPFDNNTDHTAECSAHCYQCGRIGVGRPCKSDSAFRINCPKCRKRFNNADCYAHHLNSNYCAQSKRCEKCGKTYSVKNNTRGGRPGHVCEESFCRTCRTYHNPKRGCYIQPLKARKSKPYRVIAFDCETMQNRIVAPDRKIHEVNFVSAVVVCTECMKSDKWRHSLTDPNNNGRSIIRYGPACRICGDWRRVTFSHRDFTTTRVDYKQITDNPLSSFVEWLLTKFDRRYPSVVFSHYGGRFDNVMVYRELFQRHICPEMITKGNKLYEMRIPKGDKNAETIFRDSWNLMQVQLDALVGAFGLQTQGKEFFPHLANREDNYGRVMDGLPPKEDYMYSGMTPEKQKKFDRWYASHRDEPFNLCEQLAAYCTNDTQILIEALMAFRAEFLKITAPKRDDVDKELGLYEQDETEAEDDDNGNGGIDITWEPLTIASASMKHFRLNHLDPEQLALVPEKGYDTADNQSTGALKFLQWYEEENGVHLQTASSPRGEHRIGSYTVDGYDSSSDTVIEYHGCHWHCHENCPNQRLDPEKIMPNGKSVRKIREDDEERLAFIRTKVTTVEVYWECEVEAMLKREPEMRRAYMRYHDKGPVRLRDCYFGGRTGPFRLHYEVPQGWTMKYLDVRSLYPYINASTQYPQGHPSRVNILQGAETIVNWHRPEQIPVRGILKVFVVPPPRLAVPVLPVKFDARLLFPLCRKCAIRYPRGDVNPNYRCQHPDEERGWVSTATSIELAEALRNGYRCTRYYRSIEWTEEQWSDKIFKGYIAEFQKMKTEASGFPEEINTPELEEEYIRECEELFGIQIDRDNMHHNKAKRTIAKFCNNSLWGRFSLRNGLSKTFVSDSPAVVRQFLNDPKIEVDFIEQLNEECVLIRYTPLKEWIEEHNCSNIVLSLWTTAAARLHLLKLMQKVASTPNCVLLYTDTDSLIFAYKNSMGCPLNTGPHLGDLSDEYPGHTLKEFVSGGCKQYALRMIDNISGEEKHVLKVRGITLSADACRRLHFDTFKESVLQYGRGMQADDATESDIVIDYPNFIRPSLRDGSIHSVKMCKRYSPIVTKGIVGPNFQIIDFGTK